MKYIKSYYLHAEYQIMRLGKQGPRISLFTSKECFLLLILTNIHIKLLQATYEFCCDHPKSFKSIQHVDEI
jgi:hypothetical protein